MVTPPASLEGCSIALCSPATDVTVELTDSPPPDALAGWRRLVAESPGGDVTQLPGWASVRAEAGFSARYLLAYRGSRTEAELVGGAQVLERRLPVVGRVGYIAYGPLLAAHLGEDEPAASVRRALGAAVTELGRREERMLFVQPPPGADVLGADLLERGFRRSEAGIAPGQSLRLDLAASPDRLRAGLSRRLRTWTNRWDSRGITVRAGTEDDLPVLARMVANSGQHQGFMPMSEDYLRTLVTELGDAAVLFVGELEGRPVAAALFTRCAGVLRLRFAGMDRDDAVGRYNVPAAVQWHAIRWARSAGLRWFDFGGISVEAADLLDDGGRRDELRGVDRFKAGFGGELYRCPPAVELISSAPLRMCYDVSRRAPAGRRGIALAKRALRTGRVLDR